MNRKNEELCTSMWGTKICHDPEHKDRGDFCAHCLMSGLTWEEYQKLGEDK